MGVNFRGGYSERGKKRSRPWAQGPACPVGSLCIGCAVHSMALIVHGVRRGSGNVKKLVASLADSGDLACLHTPEYAPDHQRHPTIFSPPIHKVDGETERLPK